MERVAREQVRRAEAIVEATVLRLPPGGLLRVDRVLSGRAPATIAVPYPSPCSPAFRWEGERGLVLLEQNGSASGFVRGPMEDIVRRVARDRR